MRSRHPLNPLARPQNLVAESPQRCILYEGPTGESLVTVLNAWVRGDDAPYWNRKGAYVPDLIPAALSLLDRDMIEVWEARTVRRRQPHDD